MAHMLNQKEHKRILFFVLIGLVSILFLFSRESLSQSTANSNRRGILPLLIGSLVEVDTNKTVANARVLLADYYPKDSICVINSKLTAKTDISGRFSIPNVPFGKYVFLYNLSGRLNESYNGKEIITNTSKLVFSHMLKAPKGINVPITVADGSTLENIDGELAVSGCLYSKDADIIMMATKGVLYNFVVDQNHKGVNFSVRVDIKY